MQLGNPSNASADTNNHNHYLIQRTVEAIDYNDNRGLPNWASWDLTAADIGTNARSSFITDTNLPSNFNWVTTGDYTYSGYDRGHLCPSKDRTATPEDNDMVFFMSNIMPQNSLNNSGVWNQFENYCRSLAQSPDNYELLITCGPVGFSGARINTNGPILIPDYVWKIVVVVPPGVGPATNRITATNRVIALKMPNDDTATNAWTAYVTSANQIQVDTGFTFFTALQPDVASALRARVDGQTNSPPEIFTFSPVTGEPGTSITLTGTNFSAATAVAFDGISASFTVESDTTITAVVATNAGTGFVSVTTPSGTAISTNFFTVLHNGGVVYSGLLAGWDVSGCTNYGPSPLLTTTNAAGLNIIGLSRANGVKTSGTAAAHAWGGVGFTNTTVTGAVTDNQFVAFSVTPSNGYRVSFTRISRFDYYRSPTGPTNGTLQFQIGTNVFMDITNLTYPSVSSGASLSAIDLSGIADLQDIGAGTNVTFRLVNYGGGPSGTWYVYNTQGDLTPDLSLEGSITQLLNTNPPTLTITQNNTGVILIWPSVAESFALEQNSDLTTTNWTSYSGAIGDDGTNRTALITNPLAAQFFRLSASEP